MGLAGGDNKRNIEAIALLALFLSFSSFSFFTFVTKPVSCFPGDIGTAKCPLTGGHDVTPLGTWTSMPSDPTELMGNMSYRGILVAGSPGGEGGLSAGLQVGCINPSNTVGAILQLQYANYSEISHVNTTNFMNIGGSVFIDNSVNYPCPGFLDAAAGTLPAISSSLASFIFRVTGLGGGGVGDNPRFSAVELFIQQNVAKTLSVIVSSITTTSFKFIVYSTFPLSTSTTETIQWIAMNDTAATCITLSNCFEHGSSTACVIPATGTSCLLQTITFPNAFANTPNVVATVNVLESTGRIPIGTINLLSAQTLTV